MRGGIRRRNGEKKKVQKNTEKLTKGSEGPEEAKRGLDRYPVQGSLH